MSVDDTQFSGLRGLEIPKSLNPANFDDRKIIRAHGDNVEQNMRDYLAKLRDHMLSEKPFAEGEDNVSGLHFLRLRIFIDVFHICV